MIQSNLTVELARQLRTDFALYNFVETGTAWGDTAERGAIMFRAVYTIELGLKQYVASRRRLAGGSVVCLFGHSPFVLKEVVKWLSGASLFWLDAHYSGGGTARGPTECPLLAELDAVCGHGHCVLIDDARLFRREVPLNGHRLEDWPTVADIEAKLCPGERLYHLTGQILITPREYSGCPTLSP